MSPRRQADAFVAGWAPSAAGPYFNGLELVAEAERGADVELAIHVGEERERVIATRDRCLARLDEADVAQEAVGIVPLPRPQGTAPFGDWPQEVFDAVAGALRPGSPEAVAHLLGFVLGEALATTDAIARLSRLRDVAPPDHFWMRVQGDSLERERATAERRLGRLAAHDLLPPAVQEATALAAHRLTDAAPSGSHAGRAARAAAVAEALEAQSDVIRASF